MNIMAERRDPPAAMMIWQVVSSGIVVPEGGNDNCHASFCTGRSFLTELFSHAAVTH